MARAKQNTTPTTTPNSSNTLATSIVNNAVTINGTYKNADLQKHANIISSAIAMGVSATLVICAEMATIKDMKIYNDDNFKGFGDFCEQAFGYKKSNSSAMAAVGKRFLNADGSVKSPMLKGATWTQLDALRALSDEEIEAEIAKGMSPTFDSVKSIKERVKALKAPQTDSKPSKKASGPSTPTSKGNIVKTREEAPKAKEPTATPTIKFALIITNDDKVEIVRNGKVTRPRDKSIMNDDWFAKLMDEIASVMPMK